MKRVLKQLSGAALSVLLAVAVTVSAFADEAVFLAQESAACEADAADDAGISGIAEAEETEKEETEQGTGAPAPEKDGVPVQQTGEVDMTDVYNDMRALFSERGCVNTKKNASTGLYTDIGSFWDMLAMKALGIAGNTGTDYDAADYSVPNAQVLSKFIIAMVNDGKDPSKYGIKDSGVLTVSVTELLKSYYNDETGGYGKPDKNGVKKGSIYNQPFVMFALGILDEEAGEKAGEFYASYQNEDGILGSSWGIDMDTTSWAITGCHMAGLTYPNEDKALAYMAAHTADMNANTLGCYYNCLAYLGMLTEEQLTAMVNDGAVYSASEKSFLYNGKANVSATQQASMPLGEFYNGSVYRAYDDEYVAEQGLSSKKVYARIADAKSVSETDDILKRTELTVESGASLVLEGIAAASENVTLLDVFTEAVCAEKLGRDPSLEEIEANRTYINEKLAAADTEYGLSLTRLYGYEDGGFGYYVNRETMAWSPLDEITADNTEVFLFHYDYMAASYAVFDKAEYSGTTTDPATVTVKQMGYDADWNPVFSGIPAAVTATNGDKAKTFSCAADGTAVLTGLSAGTYELTASYGTEEAYIVSPYAVLTVTKGNDSPSYSGGGSGAGYEKPVTTGSWDAPVTDGSWIQTSGGRWQYKTNGLFRSTWGYIRNPYAKAGAQDAWFWFDSNGYMLTGWQQIRDTDGMLRWYYLNPVSDGSLGACFLNGTTPDGYTVNENGAWTVNGVIQETKDASVTGTAQTAGTGSSSKKTAGTFSISLSANVKTDDGRKVSFSGSKSFDAEEYEGTTVFDALAALCDEKGWTVEGDGSYVSAVNGLAEFDAGEQSGWMYSVNGKYPEIPAGEYTLKKGDRVVWRYVTSWVNTGM